VSKSDSRDDDLRAEFTRYIFCYYTHLLSPHEYEAWQSIMIKGKATMGAACHIPGIPSHKRRQGTERLIRRSEIAQERASADPRIGALLKRGESDFFFSVALRVLRDNRQEVVLNLCPKCLALCKTPRAKQCPKCYYRWHNVGDASSTETPSASRDS